MHLKKNSPLDMPVEWLCDWQNADHLLCCALKTRGKAALIPSINAVDDLGLEIDRNTIKIND